MPREGETIGNVTREEAFLSIFPRYSDSRGISDNIPRTRARDKRLLPKILLEYSQNVLSQITAAEYSLGMFSFRGMRAVAPSVKFASISDT